MMEKEDRSDLELNKVGVRLPPFWADDPALWFAQVEGQFFLAGITSDTTKFYHISSQLEQRFAQEVKDIIKNPPAENKYKKLKTELIKRLTASQERRIQQLLAQEELGDRKPSQFLRHLQNLAGPAVPDEFLRTLWTDCRQQRLIDGLTSLQVTASIEIPTESDYGSIKEEPQHDENSKSLPFKTRSGRVVRFPNYYRP
ncbi:uncharacterized protein LOC123696400 isoform X3 [Colias croceus]|uniref:uncharacterized protein LOC123696400 isoform X3 n=1 Tax=Colias crocea TaxID=72248 RepID=UPI001E27F23D|nr:uncharacterized protein LOC123696400 isoform X3 [Colias croceus]